MKAPTVKFNIQDRPEFYKELRKRVDQYFKDNNISKYANLNMKIKTAAMIGLYFIPLVLIISGVFTTFWPLLAMWLLMGLGMSGIGLSILHDANHSSYSRNQKVNKFFGYLMNALGAYHITWKIQHNVLHHSFTNVEGHDEDIENEVMRFSPHSEQKSIYRYQIFYAIFFYGLMTFNKLLLKDFKQINKYAEMNLLAGQGVTLKNAIREIVMNKIIYSFFVIFLPILLCAIPWWQTVLAFLAMHAISGIILALVFQAAHVLEETEYFVAEEGSSLENNWAIHQMKTTANFGTKSTVLTWLVGGLNHQVEHHLFPDICHIHYTKISTIVESTAKEYNISYLNHNTFFAALVSHFKFLNHLGKEELDSELAHL